ncbi:MAG: phenylacetate--CoA ligase family protein [Planctomycetes bacterium]|nr:phenylacetate--CoA ligase family protein [Planctomycetota bacterium]
MPTDGQANNPNRPTPNARAREREEQQRWRVRPGFAQASWFNSLVESEFLAEEELRDWQRRCLTELIALAARDVRYYRDMFVHFGLRPEEIRDVSDLVRLPVLSRRNVIDLRDTLRLFDNQAEEPGVICTSSSGSTGHPVQVVHTESSMILTRLLHQRQLRWFRVDPAATFAWIRIPKDLIRSDGKPLPPGETLHATAWPRIGSFVETGPFIAFSKSNCTEAKVEWLEAHRPNYLQAASAQLEHLALTFQDRPPMEGLRGLWAVGEPLTPGMRRRIEEVFRVPVHVAYGLDELGWIAVMCSEGRYHVHPERAIVEIVDDAGQPCAPGTPGHLLVTLLGNPAMPLLRYDTGDLAEPVAGPCSCGRTMPGFGPVIARAGRLRDLPPGTMERVSPLIEAMENLRLPLSTNLREYRVHQNSDNSFELRLITTGPMGDALKAHIHRVWGATGGQAPDLRIVEVDHLPQTQSGKFFQFTSAHMGAASDGDSVAEAE